MSTLIKKLHTSIGSLQQALNEELDKVVLSENKFEKMIDDSPGDISSRYWLMQFLEPLNRKEIKSVVDGFLVQLMNEEQAKKLVKFLLVRFPNYYKDEIQKTTDGMDIDLDDTDDDEESDNDHGILK